MVEHATAPEPHGDTGGAPQPAEAMRIAHACGAALATAAVERPLSECVCEVLAQPVCVVRDVPHYDSSAMDGFAVRGAQPWELGVDAWPVATGSPVPAQADSVVRQEWVVASEGSIRLAAHAPKRDLEPGRNIRRAGREARAGDPVARAGDVLTPAQVAFAAVAGHDVLPVRARPRVGLLLTGAEVVPTGLPEPGFVRDAFGPQLPAYVGMLGAEVVQTERIGDGEAETRDAVDRLAAISDIVVSTGGTGHSRVDEVRRLAERRAGEATGEILFAELDMRPGHPTFLMKHSGVVHVGLPGNPLAAMVALRLVLAQVVRGALGRSLEQPGAVVLAHDFDPGSGRAGAGGVTRVMPARPAGTSAMGTNPQRWELCDKRGSNMLRGLAQASGLVIIPPEGALAGDPVACLPLPV